MPRLKAECATCTKRITTKDFETGMVTHSEHTGRRWCPKCNLKSIRKWTRA